MSGQLVKHPGNVPLHVKVKAWWQWSGVCVTYIFGVLLTYFPMGLLVASTSKRQASHPLGKPLAQTHDQRYIDEGSSGVWEYWNSNLSFLESWNNLEDGTLRESSGKNSAACKGKERSVLNQYLWLCRNPYNWAKRTTPKYFCRIDDCDIEYWGEFELSDKTDNQQGSQWVVAKNRLTGKSYYGYRSVRVVSDTEVRHCRLGFKISPIHAMTTQDFDDMDKSITFRLPVKTTID